jgi:hypothetical protein
LKIPALPDVLSRLLGGTTCTVMSTGDSVVLPSLSETGTV